jgi:hypothetical protein
MDTIIALAQIVFGFVPFIATGVVITAIIWTATRLFPKFGELMNNIYDAMMGTNDDYDRDYGTGYIRNPRRW